MNVKPEYMSFGELFKNSNIFYTPTYQRDYSWEEEQIEQFCSDILDALTKKNQGKVASIFLVGLFAHKKKFLVVIEGLRTC